MYRLLLTYLGLCLVPLVAQESEVRFDSITTKQATVLKSRPSNSAATLKAVAAGVPLQWVERQTRDHWLRILVPGGSLGWVNENAIKIVPSALAAPRDSSVTPAQLPCAADLNACQPQGCAIAGSARAAMNRAKRSFSAAAPASITMADFQLLQSAADGVVVQGHDIQDRSVLRHLRVGARRILGEGTAVRLQAHLAFGPGAPRPNTGESVNCGLSGPANNDFHIPVTESAQQTEYEAVVTEMIPQGAVPGSVRHPGWSLNKLDALRASQRQVKIVGTLFYDNAHVVNPDAQNPLPSQPRRFSLWEIHPISQFLVCKRVANNCVLEKSSDWTPLENWK